MFNYYSIIEYWNSAKNFTMRNRRTFVHRSTSTKLTWLQVIFLNPYLDTIEGMIQMNSLDLLLRKWSLEEIPPVIQLLNHDRSPVAALYLNKLNLDKVAILEVDSKILTERYYVFMDGIAIFFTYMRKSTREEIF